MGMYIEIRMTATSTPTKRISTGSSIEPNCRIRYSKSRVSASAWFESISGKRLVSSPTRISAANLRS